MTIELNPKFEKILDKRTSPGSGKTWYLVKWTKEETESWEPEENVFLHASSWSPAKEQLAPLEDEPEKSSSVTNPSEGVVHDNNGEEEEAQEKTESHEKERSESVKEEEAKEEEHVDLKTTTLVKEEEAKENFDHNVSEKIQPSFSINNDVSASTIASASESASETASTFASAAIPSARESPSNHSVASNEESISGAKRIRLSADHSPNQRSVFLEGGASHRNSLPSILELDNQNKIKRESQQSSSDSMKRKSSQQDQLHPFQGQSNFYPIRNSPLFQSYSAPKEDHHLQHHHHHHHLQQQQSNQSLPPVSQSRPSLLPASMSSSGGFVSDEQSILRERRHTMPVESQQLQPTLNPNIEETGKFIKASMPEGANVVAELKDFLLNNFGLVTADIRRGSKGGPLVSESDNIQINSSSKINSFHVRFIDAPNDFSIPCTLTGTRLSVNKKNINNAVSTIVSSQNSFPNGMMVYRPISSSQLDPQQQAAMHYQQMQYSNMQQQQQLAYQQQPPYYHQSPLAPSLSPPQMSQQSNFLLQQHQYQQQFQATLQQNHQQQRSVRFNSTASSSSISGSPQIAPAPASTTEAPLGISDLAEIASSAYSQVSPDYM